MRRRNKEINIFSMSALDLFASALGAFILIAVVLFPYFPNIGSSPEHVAALRAQLREARQQLQTCQTDLTQSRAEFQQSQESLRTRRRRSCNNRRSLRARHKRSYNNRRNLCANAVQSYAKNLCWYW